MPQRLHIAALQPPLRWRQPMPNMITLRKMAEELPSGVDVVVLPEMWTGMTDDHDVAVQAGQAAQFLQTLAKACGVIVVGGSFQRPAASGRPHTGVFHTGAFHTGVLHNVCLIVDRRGEIVGEYVKGTLFSHERDTHEPGSEPGVFEVDGFRIGVQICADLWWPERTRQLIDRVDVLCVPAKTAVPSDNHVVYARTLWHALELTRAAESGLPVIVSDWAAGRHMPTDVDMSTGGVHARGTNFDRGILYQRHRDHTASPTASGPNAPTATAHTSATPALGAGVHFTAGVASICNPAHRPDMEKLQRTLPRGEAGYLCEQIDLDAVAAFRDYRRRAGLLPDPAG